jgi:hypothetical protein
MKSFRLPFTRMQKDSLICQYEALNISTKSQFLIFIYNYRMSGYAICLLVDLLWLHYIGLSASIGFKKEQ